MTIDPSDIEGTIPASFRKIVELRRGHPAVRKAEESISYTDLDAESDRIAGNLVAGYGAEPGPVAILLAPGIPAITAMLGIMKAGKMLVLLPMDANPHQLAAIWENARRPPLLTDADHRPLAASFAQPDTLLQDVHQAAGSPFDTSRVLITADTDAMLTYSSGTTSEPKGVVSSHRMILHSTRFYSDIHHYSQPDRITYLSTYSSSAAMSYNFYSILCGATLVFPPAGYASSFPYIEWLQREKISILSITALPLFQQYLRSYRGKIPLPDLREITIGGQELTRAEVEELRRYCSPEAIIVHRLASSDVNQISELWIRPGSDIPWEKIPVGKSVPGKEVLLLDGEHHPVAFGETGEIAVRSRYLPSGYWRQPELSRQKFLPDPDDGLERIFMTGDIGRFLPDGLLDYCGRKDNLVRIQNQNVQLEEIENQLRQIPGVRETSVQVTPWGSGEKRLAAYIVPEDGSRLTVDILRRKLTITLSSFMIPSLYVFLEALPKSAAGKVDRNALPEPSTARPLLSTPFQKPRNEVEEKLCTLWSNLLHVGPIGVNDDYYDLGGDSLLVLSMTLEVEQEFERPIPQAFYRSMKVATLSRYWGQEDHGESPTATIPSSIPAPARNGKHRGTRLSADPDRSRAAKAIPRSNPGISLSTFVVSRLPYEAGIRWAARFCRFPPMRRFYLRRQILLFRRFRASLGGCPTAPADAEAVSLVGNLLWSAHIRAGMGELAELDSLEGMRRSPSIFWRDLARIIDSPHPETFNRLFPVDGWEHLENAYAAGKGVILVTLHSTSARIASTVIRRRLHSRPIQTISRKRAQRLERLRGEEDPDALSTDELALTSDLLMQAYQTLKHGQVIQLVPDGKAFSVSEEPVSIAGRRTYIQSGFAKIALLSDAAIVPVLATRRLDGSIRSTFFPPLIPADGNASVDGKITDLIRQYADFLERSWRSAPECVTWSKMEKHLDRPISDGHPA
jgi:acyl-coenzyme A synthetase/AMP-(fatty) acid ligase/lauroyl/myristoyl acyltransferase